MSDGHQMDSRVNVRPIRQEDAGAVAELVAQLGYQRTPDEVRQWVSDLGSWPEHATFVAEFKGEVVAWIDVSLEHHLQSEAFGLIGGLVVKDGVRGAGIGRRLCEQAELWSRRQGGRKDSGHLPQHSRGRPSLLSARRLSPDEGFDGV